MGERGSGQPRSGGLARQSLTLPARKTLTLKSAPGFMLFKCSRIFCTLAADAGMPSTLEARVQEALRVRHVHRIPLLLRDTFISTWAPARLTLFA